MKFTAAYKAYLSWLNSLPTWAQSLILAIEVAIGGVVYNYLTNPQGLCFSKACLRTLLAAIGLALSYSVHNWAKGSPLALLQVQPQQMGVAAGQYKQKSPADPRA